MALKSEIHQWKIKAPGSYWKPYSLILLDERMLELKCMIKDSHV